MRGTDVRDLRGSHAGDGSVRGRILGRAAAVAGVVALPLLDVGRGVLARRVRALVLIVLLWVGSVHARLCPVTGSANRRAARPVAGRRPAAAS